MTNRIPTLLQFLEEDPDDSFTRFALAQEYAKQGDHEQAATFFEELVRKDPTYIGAYYHLGRLYERVGRREEAVATYEEGIRRAEVQRDTHARAELQSALMEAQAEW